MSMRRVRQPHTSPRTGRAHDPVQVDNAVPSRISYGSLHGGPGRTNWVDLQARAMTIGIPKKRCNESFVISLHGVMIRTLKASGLYTIHSI